MAMRKMKDSGILGVGKVPISWEQTRLGYECYIRARLGWRGLKADEYVDEGYAFISAFNIQDGKLVWEPLNYITQERYDPFQNAKEHIEKGFMSTSIIDGDINKIHKGRYKLIILLPSSCRAFYVDEISKRCGEYELLLCRNTHLKEIARKKQKGITFILCKANV